QLQELRDDPALIKGAVEEVLRYESPIRAMGRLVKDDFALDGRALQEGQTITLVLGAANRDPARYSDPDRFDIRRADTRHLAFGHGPHFCIGAPLARLEGQIAISAVLRRLPALRLATDAPEWDPNILFRGLKSLPVVF
ncbi:MAG TPA: cytochrome P450, partial [Chloroflexia bacterium]|nr:cytochrome P450 [Chloroflexia bacterium]